MTEINASLLQKKLIFKRFKLKKLLDISDFSWVYEGKNILKNVPVAIKIEKKGNFNLLESEAYFLTTVKGFGIPEIISFGKYGPFKILVEELLGKDIDTLWESGPYKNDRFGQKNKYIKDICLLAMQGLERLKYIHDKNIIHRDIKTKNFLIGRKDPEVIYLIDFGFAKKYRSSRTGKHIRFSNIKTIIGSLTFSSCNAIKGYESSRRDDLESFGYVLIYLAKCGWMPWKIYTEKNKINLNDIEKIIRKIKLETTEENFCKGLPDEFINYLKYVKKLEFEQEPDYKYLTNLFSSILAKNEFKKNITFFWIRKSSKKSETRRFLCKENNSEVINNSLNKKLRGFSFKRLYSKIKNSLENKNISDNNNNRFNTIKSGEQKININYKRFNVNLNNSNNNISTKNTERKFPKLLTGEMTYKPFTTLNNSYNIKKNKFKVLNINNKNNNISMFQKYNINNKNIIRNKNPIKCVNSSLSYGKNIILYNNINYTNIYFIKKNSQNKKQNITNYSKLNKSNKEKIKNQTPKNSFNNLNFKGNILYKPIFENISSNNLYNY